MSARVRLVTLKSPLRCAEDRTGLHYLLVTTAQDTT